MKDIDILGEALCFGLCKKDGEYPRVIIDTNTKIPSKGRFLEENGSGVNNACF
jgi:hypothetical protein